MRTSLIYGSVAAAMLAIALPVIASPVPILTPSGQYSGVFQTDPGNAATIQFGQSVGGFSAATVSGFAGGSWRLDSTPPASYSQEPLSYVKGGNDTIQAWIWVNDGDELRGIDRIFLKQYSDTHSTDGFDTVQVNWVPTATGEWQYFSADLSEWTTFVAAGGGPASNDGALWDDDNGYLAKMYAYFDQNGQTKFSIRDFGFVQDAIPEPASICTLLIGVGLALVSRKQLS